MTERAGGADGACGQLWLVTSAQHGGQGKYTHGHNGCANDPRARGQQRTHDDDGNAKATRPLSKQSCHVGEEIFCDLRSFQHDPHKDKERHCHERFITHRAEDASGERGQIIGVKVPNQNA